MNLPSRFKGGTVVIEHDDENRRVGGCDKQLTLIACYAECHHEVRLAEQGGLAVQP